MARQNSPQNDKKKYLNNLFLAILSLVVLSDLTGNLDFNLDRLFYKVNPLFADLITIIPNLNELNLYEYNSSRKISSSETMGRPMNYPLIWVYIFDFLGKFTNPINFFGYSQILFYFIYIYYNQDKIFKNNLLLLLILFSPPILLALERGNNDLTIFMILIVSYFSPSFFKGFLLGLATSLKVYPVFLFPIYFLLKKIDKGFLLGLLISLPLIFFTILQINIYIDNTSISFSSSFGILSTSLFFQKIISIFFQTTSNKTYLIFTSLAIFLVILLIFNNIFKKEIEKLIFLLSKDKKNLELFILSSSLSVCIFFVFSNWAYRLIFLLPSIIIFIKEFNLNYHLSNLKNFIFFLLITSPFLATWILIPSKEILLNHYSWVFFAPITFVSICLYLLILIKGVIIFRKNF